jgi:putative transposase
VVVIDGFIPSCLKCSNCQHLLSELKLSEREWDCPICGTHHDRDLAPAANIKNEAVTTVELPKVTPMERE